VERDLSCTIRIQNRYERYALSEPQRTCLSFDISVF
jgi:hypothetical protein